MTKPDHHVHFTKKYQAKTTRDIIGQDAQLKEIKKGVEEFGKTKKKKALLIYGPPGTGKTSSIHALASELDLEIIEVNASDVRNADGLEQTVGPAIKQMSLFSKGKVILIDEVDGISGTNDRGGLPAIIKFIEESHFPIILTANDPFDQKFSSLRKACTLIEYKALSFLDTLSHLKKICEKEGIKCDDDALNYLARSSAGDMRSALNDLQNVTSSKKTITRKDVEVTSEREREDKIENALLKVFKTTNPEIALGAFDYVDEDIDKIFLWLDENLPKEYKKTEDLARAYENMSLADVYFGRIRRWQYYRFYVYIYNLLSAGIAISKKEKNPEAVKYEQTGRILKIWMANQKHAKRIAIAKKLAAHTHTAVKHARSDVDYLKYMFKHSKDKPLLEKLSEELSLDDEEVEWLKK